MKYYQVAVKVKRICPNCSNGRRIAFVFQAVLFTVCPRCGLVELNDSEEEVEREVSKAG